MHKNYSGKLIQSLREKNSWSQHVLAEKISDLLGRDKPMTRAVVCRIEKGGKKMPRAWIEPLAKLFYNGDSTRLDAAHALDSASEYLPEHQINYLSVLASPV